MKKRYRIGYRFSFNLSQEDRSYLKYFYLPEMEATPKEINLTMSALTSNFDNAEWRCVEVTNEWKQSQAAEA